MKTKHTTPFREDTAGQFATHYDEKTFWKKLRTLAGRAGRRVAYPALQLYYVLTSRQVPVRQKAIIVGALGYLILPADLIPDFIPLAGYTDDLAALTTALRAIDSSVDDEIRQKAHQKATEMFPLPDRT